MDDYISREETVKAFCEKCRGYYDGHCVHRGECDVDVIQNAPSCVPQWISVKDRLPYKAGRYLVHVENTANYHRLPDDIVIAVWVIKGWGFEGVEYNRVTHWMPLPELPKE